MFIVCCLNRFTFAVCYVLCVIFGVVGCRCAMFVVCCLFFVYVSLCPGCCALVVC